MRVETLERFKEMLRITSTYDKRQRFKESSWQFFKNRKQAKKIVRIGRSKFTENYVFLKTLVDICGIDFCRPTFS